MKNESDDVLSAIAIGVFKAEARQQYDVAGLLRRCHDRIAALESQLADRDAEIERLRAENAELRADLVWAVQKGAGFAAKDGKLVLDYDFGQVPVECTFDSICRAVREARDGVS